MACRDNYSFLLKLWQKDHGQRVHRLNQRLI